MPNFGFTSTPNNGFFFDDFGNCQFFSNIGNMPSPGGYLTDMYLYISGDGGTADCWFMIWNGSANPQGSSIIFESGATSIPGGSRSVDGQAWRHTTMPNPPYVSAGTQLWVGIWTSGHVVWTYGANSPGGNGNVFFQRSVNSGGQTFNFVGGNQEGSGVFGAYVTYTPVNAPSISSLSTGSGTGGQGITIYGSSFTHADIVQINGANASFNVINDGQINATIPVGASYGPGNVYVHNPSGWSNAASFYDGAPPSITSISPDSGPVGTVPSLGGSGFQYVSSASVAGTGASFSIVNDSSMTVTIPSVGTGWQTIQVNNPAGSGTGSFFVGNVPNITSVSPVAGPRGTVVTLSGSNFTYVTNAYVNGAGASFSVSSDTSMTVTVPNGAPYGVGSIVVFNPSGESNAIAFSVGGIAHGRRGGAWVTVPPQGRRLGAWVQGVTAQGRRNTQGGWVNTV